MFPVQRKIFLRRLNHLNNLFEMEIPFTVKPRPDTGLYNGKLGVWLFLASEVMLFGALFSSYVLLRVGAAEGTWSMGLMNIGVGAGNTMVLIASSMFVVLAWAELKQGNLAGYKKWKWATVACAVLFLVVKWGYEWPSKFVHYDVWFKESAVLYEKVEEGYLHDGENIEADLLNEEEDKKLSLARLYLEKEIYVERFFKTFSKEEGGSRNAFNKAWETGSLALSGHINGYDEAQINVEVTGWKPDSGVSGSEADKILTELDVSGLEGDAKQLRSQRRLLLEKVDYDSAKLAEYQLTNAGFSVALSVAGYDSVKAHPYFWRTARINEDIGGKPRVKSIIFALDASHHEENGEVHHKEITIKTDDVKRLNSYEPKHSTFFGIYYTITSLHALHVFGGIVVMIYNLLPIGLRTWYRDREQYANRIECFGLFWHFVDLVWIFLFPILYIL